jgi:hypothetical protein
VGPCDGNTFQARRWAILKRQLGVRFDSSAAINGVSTKQLKRRNADSFFRFFSEKYKLHSHMQEGLSSGGIEMEIVLSAHDVEKRRRSSVHMAQSDDR